MSRATENLMHSISEGKHAPRKECEAVSSLENKIYNGGDLTKEEALYLSSLCDKSLLYEAAHRITAQLCGKKFDTCSIINVKSGNCPEDCKWCAQSIHFHTGCVAHSLLTTEECVAQACYNRAQGVNRFSLVAVGRTQSLHEINKMASIIRAIRAKSDVQCCVSLGLLDEEKLRILYEAGVTTYHCNMESSPRHFKKLVSTHTQQEKIETIRAARKVGMRVCSGGIIGMGESMEERIDFAFLLRELQIFSIPINILHPIAGTPLEKMAPLTEEEYLTTIALFRFIHPYAFLRFSGGRIQVPLPTVRKAMYIGVNSAITGDMLTTVGARAKEDMELIREMGYSTALNTDWEVINE